MRTFAPQLAVLPLAQRQVWPSLAGTIPLGFVLYGGTALALRLGHRPSLDFDFFSDRPLDRAALAGALPLIQSGQVLQDDRETWTLLVSPMPTAPPSVKLSFFGGLRLGRVGEPEQTDDGVALVASRADLLATKLKVLLQRVEAKDYLDIAALLETGASLAQGLADARALYGATFQPSECLKALVYFQGGDLDMLSTQTRTTLITAAAAVGALPVSSLRARTLT
ncbi:MAG TPA: nucleotidyl transferase AbiEii/AbiGii toxin family protein [Ktedonobacterales bacterium]